MNVAFGDVFNDGRLSIYKTNISEPGVLVQANDLWVPKKPAAAAPAFEDLASSLGIDLGGWSWGAQFGDLNNDGVLDLYLVNGYVSAGERTSYWYDFAQIAVGHSAIISDALNWPPMNGRSLSGYQRKRVWINDGLGRFTDVAQVVGATDVYDGRASRSPISATAACSMSSSPTSEARCSSIATRCSRDATGSISSWKDGAATAARSARASNCIGATACRSRKSTAAAASAPQNQRRLHYGLGDRGQIDRVVIRWPSGTVQTIEHPPVDTLQRVKEPA